MTISEFSEFYKVTPCPHFMTVLLKKTCLHNRKVVYDKLLFVYWPALQEKITSSSLFYALTFPFNILGPYVTFHVFSRLIKKPSPAMQNKCHWLKSLSWKARYIPSLDTTIFKLHAHFIFANDDKELPTPQTHNCAPSAVVIGGYISVLNRSQNSESIIRGVFDSIIDSKSILC